MSVDLGGNAGAEYSSVLVTVKEVWFNENATAAPDDSTWVKFPLSGPETLELVNVSDVAMSELASRLKVSPGTYHQIRLLLVDRAEPLTASASQAGATYNDQVTYVDASGVETTLPLEVPAAAHGVGIDTDLVVPAAKRAVLAALAAASNTGAASSLATQTSMTSASSAVGATATTPVGATTTTPVGSTATTPVGSTTTTPVGSAMPTVGVPTVTVPTPPATANGAAPTPSVPSPAAPAVTPPVPAIGTTTPSPSQTADTTVTASGAAAPSAATVTSRVLFDAARDLTMFRFADRPGFLLNPSLTAYDTDAVGYIVAQLDVAAVAVNPGTGRPDVEVTAETLNGDSTRRVVVASALVRADGTFTLYPLPIASGTNGDSTTYDLVIHGPAVTSVIVRDVPATKGAPDSSSTAAFATITLLASQSYGANLAAGSAVEPRGARVQFYQTLPDDAAPYVIAERAVDPLTGRLAADEPLSAAPVVVYGTLGPSFSLASAAPTEGAAAYSVAAVAQLHAGGALSGSVVAPPTAGTTAVFTVPSVAVPSEAAAGTITATVTAAPGKYDDGALLVTHDGALVTAAPLAAALAGTQPATVQIANVPAGAGSGFERGLYYLEAWAWNSANPQGSFTRQPVSAAVDLRGAAAASIDVGVD